MSYPVLDLVRNATVDRLATTAAPWIVARSWSNLVAVLACSGQPPAEIGVVATNDDESPGQWWHHGYTHRADLLLDIAIADEFTEELCEWRFGGGGRGGRAPRTPTRRSIAQERLASELAAAVLADLPSSGWTASPDTPDRRPDFVCALSLSTLSETESPIRIGLSGKGLSVPATGIEQESWGMQLSGLIGNVRLPVRGVLARPVLSAGDLARLSVGDVLPIRSPERVTLLAGKSRLATGRLIESDGHASVQIDPLGEVE